jgi:predicted GNAT family acetyltransferase
MSDVQLKFENNDRGAFVIEGDGERLAEMSFGRNGTNLIIYHTEVSEKLKGQGIGLQLLERMVNFAREENLQVVPLCPYVLAQFRRHPVRYVDIWNKHWHEAK